METVTFYDSKGEVLRRHRVAIKLARIGKLKTFSFSDMEILHGPDKGKRVNVRGSYIYSLQNDSFYEANNLLEGDAAEPSLTIWKRAGEVDG
jgi:hypothetical protein